MPAVAAAFAALLLVSGAGAVPGWYWQWAKWRLGHDRYICHAGDPAVRPDVPEKVPAWAWDHLHRHTPSPCVKSAPAAPAAGAAKTPAPSQPNTAAAVTLDPAEAELRDAVNAARRASGLPDLTIDPRLERAARERTADLNSHGYFAHEWHDGTPFATWITRYWPCAASGEILVMSTPSVTAEQAVQLWLASPSHRANMLSPDWRSMGVELGGSHGTVDFGGPC